MVRNEQFFSFSLLRLSRWQIINHSRTSVCTLSSLLIAIVHFITTLRWRVEVCRGRFVLKKWLVGQHLAILEFKVVLAVGVNSLHFGHSSRLLIY